ncbi:MAG: hypothetical protein WC761_02900 [Candidatus Paceibacterota bacterium]|jgi:tRNA pseudouridine55 synthase
MILRTEKKEGETPLELINRLRTEGVISDEKATYAGRLDPMASGAMIILTGEDVHRKEEFFSLDKEYEVEILFGFATDSYDILGKLTDHVSTIVDELKVKEALPSFVGKFVQEYPRYSSKVIAMAEVPEELPTREVEIYSIEYVGDRKEQSASLLQDIEVRINKVKGDFRQEEIIALWKNNLENTEEEFLIVKIRVKCSSGTYMRTLAHELGKKLIVPALAYSIKRVGMI